jgi:hypothetical protein
VHALSSFLEACAEGATKICEQLSSERRLEEPRKKYLREQVREGEHRLPAPVAVIGNGAGLLTTQSRGCSARLGLMCFDLRCTAL